MGGGGGEGWGWCGITSHITILVPTARFAPLHTDNSGNHADPWPITICHSTVLRLNSIWKSSLFQSMKWPSWLQVKRQKWSNDRTENGKCINVTNRRGRVGLSTPFYTTGITILPTYIKVLFFALLLRVIFDISSSKWTELSSKFFLTNVAVLCRSSEARLQFLHSLNLPL